MPKVWVILLDSNRIVRGFYNGFDTVRQETLVRDIPLLMLEKDTTSPSVFRDFIPILPLIFTAPREMNFNHAYTKTLKVILKKEGLN